MSEEQKPQGEITPTPDASPKRDDIYGQYDDPYEYGGAPAAETKAVTAAPPPAPPSKGTPRRPPQVPAPDPEDEEEEGMLRMSFLEHLEELRTRLIQSLMGLGIIFFTSLIFANEIWDVISAPALSALRNAGIKDPKLVIISPMEGFSIIWMKAPLLVSLFLAAPWLLWQVWLFIAPGLYKRERRWAIPFVVSTAGLFLIGGAFAYFVAFRFGLQFLLTVGSEHGTIAMVSISEYFDLFVDVILGVGLVFEMPILVFFLILLRVVSPGFLIDNSRYAILAITIAAAVVTPTPDVFNMMLFAIPMVILYFLGVFAGYLLVLKREKRRFPWKAFGIYVGSVAGVVALVVAVMVLKYGFHFVAHWPFLTR